jgi:hypothetical protein
MPIFVKKVMESLEKMLEDGHDRRTLAHNERVIRRIRSQLDFDRLFQMLYHPNRVISMRAVDAIEKITSKQPEFLAKHKQALLELFYFSRNIEMRWHMALLVIRVPLNPAQFGWVWDVLKSWAGDKRNSRLVRVSALQSLYDMSQKDHERSGEFEKLAEKIEREEIPSVNARIRSLRKQRAA